MAKASKEEQRKTPILRFKGFTDDWEQRELGNLLKINSGKDYKHLKKGDIPVYGTSGYMLSVNESLSKNNAIGIGRKGTIDLKAPFWTVDTLFFLTLKHTNDLNFIYYKFQNINWKKYDESTGVPSLTKNTINKIKINIPELDEQNKIKLLFRSLDNLITLYERKVKLLSQIKKYFLDNLFAEKEYPNLRFKGFTDDWEQRKLGQLMEIGSVKRIHMNEWKNTGIPFLRARDIVAKFNNKKISDSIYISEETYNSNILKSGKVKKGQLLITGVGTIGIPYLITDNLPLYFKDGNVIWLKNNNYDGNFIFYFFTTNLFKNYLFKITGTGTVGTYTIENAKKTPISIPQIKEQVKIGKLFNILENLLTLYEDKQQHLTEIKKTLLNTMFI